MRGAFLPVLITVGSWLIPLLALLAVVSTYVWS